MTPLWIFCLLLAGLIICSFLETMVGAHKMAIGDGSTLTFGTAGTEAFGVVSDSSGNTTNYATNSQYGSSTFSTSYDPSSGTSSVDNYNHYDGTSTNPTIASGTTYYGPTGGTAKVITGSDGKQVVIVTLPNDPTPTTYNYVTVNQWKGPNGTATLVQSTSGQAALQIALNNGQTYLFTTSQNPPPGPPPPPLPSTNTYNEQYYNQPPPPPPPPGATTTGISAGMIPPGQEDLYVLKSSIPVMQQTPPNPYAIVFEKDKGKCAPCPPCGRCPEPSFDCKKVPNYTKVDNDILPVPVLSDFSQFGM